MKILKEGNAPDVVFICELCDCEFVATSKEYAFLNMTSTNSEVMDFICKCPICKQNVEARIRKDTKNE